MGTFAKAQGPIDLFTVTFEAGSTITDLQVLELGTNQFEVVPCANNNSKNVIGVCQKSSTSVLAGNPVPVRVHGITKVIAADGNIAAGDFLKATNTAKVTTITAAATQQNIIGRALQASQAAGDEITMLLLTVPGAQVS